MYDTKYALEIMKQELGNKYISPEIKYAFKASIGALKKQLSKKVTNVYLANGKREYGVCPACGHTVLRRHGHECCCWCGQRLDWESDDGFSNLNKM